MIINWQGIYRNAEGIGTVWNGIVSYYLAAITINPASTIKAMAGIIKISATDGVSKISAQKGTTVIGA